MEYKRTQTQSNASKETKPRETKVLSGWNRDTIAKGSPEEARHIDALLNKVEQVQADFLTYPDDMSTWAKPSELQTKLDQMNETYCRYMLDMCADPLSHGVNRENVCEAIGMYIGMTLFSSDFRKTVNKDVANTIFPVAEKLVRADAKVSDFIGRGQQRIAAGIERVTGKEIPGHDKLFNRIPKQETSEAYLSDIRDAVGAANNHGRIPFTPESAAVMHLQFGAQAYRAMREPGADIEDIQQKYASANETLKFLAGMDGISEEQLDRNVRAVYGKISSRHPDIAKFFEETAYDGVEAAEADIEVGPDNIKRSVWRGQFKTKSGAPYTGDFTPRAPRTKAQNMNCAKAVFTAAYNNCDTIDEIAGSWKRHEFDDAMQFTADLIDDDAVIDPDDQRSAYDIISAAHMSVGMAWGEAHPMTDAEKQQAQQKHGRDTSGLGDFGPADGSESQYY